MQRLAVPISSPEATDASRFGPKAANLARLAQAGLPTPGGYAIDAAAYRAQLKALGLEEISRKVFGTGDSAQARRHALQMKLGLMDEPLAPALLTPLLQAWKELAGQPCVVRSSALVEDRYGTSFAGQFESFLGLEDEAEFLIAVRACWAALWMTRALRYMATHDIDPADTAMALIVQPLVPARVAGGALSRTADGDMLINATHGLGSSIAQGEVVPDRYVLSSAGDIKEGAAGRKYRRLGCVHSRAARHPLFAAPCLEDGEVIALGRMMKGAEQLIGGPVEIEWAADESGLKLLQARPLHMQTAPVPDEIWLTRPRLSGHPAGVGWGTGRACVITCECELARVAPGDVLVTTVAGPALAGILPRVAGVVAELGGSTSHLASIARERGTPMVLGVADATQRIADGAQVAVDGVAGIVRWTKA